MDTQSNHQVDATTQHSLRAGLAEDSRYTALGLGFSAAIAQRRVTRRGGTATCSR